MPPRVGARQGPIGPLPAPTILATPPVAVAASSPAPVTPTPSPTPVERREPARPREVALTAPPAVAPAVPIRSTAEDPADEMMEMPLELPVRANGSLLDDAPGANGPIGEQPAIPMPIDPERPIPITPVAPVTSTPAEARGPDPGRRPNLIQTARQFLDALSRPGSGPRTLVIAADADLDLPACRPRGTAGW